MTKIKLLINQSEIGAGTRGSSLGPNAMKIAALNAGSDFFFRNKQVIIPNENEQLYEHVDTPFAKRIEAIQRVFNNVCNAVKQTLDEASFPVIVAADHASAGGTIAGLKAKFPKERLGVIWIDAHADLHNPYTTPSGNVHGMPLATAIADDNIEMQKNNIEGKTLTTWKAIKSMGGIEPKILPKDIVFIGVRDTEKEEEHLMQKHNMRNFTVAEVKRNGPDTVAQQALAELSDCDKIFLSFDVDSMDCELVSMGTGTPVPNGLNENESTHIINQLLKDPRVCAFELVEVNPTLDNKCNTMAETAFRVLERACQVINS